jgi:hypothetical protein
MAIRKDESTWRQKRWDWHGESVYEDIQRVLAGKKFLVKNVGELPALDHLAPSTAYDTASAICSYLEHDNKIRRLGRYFQLREQKPIEVATTKPEPRKKKNDKTRAKSTSKKSSNRKDKKGNAVCN